mmetsp:Transcript_32742/g.47803  ORF Transcript_32742/g.47803 Transcript_32742/m.47803 type:complete len:209 (+) Transcript_32742:317-943(+)
MYHVSPLFYTFAIDIWAWYNQLANCKAFKRMDKDGSGSVNKEEMYSGLLLLQLNLAKYAGPSACKPPKRKVVDEIFDDMDKDKSGKIEEEEFVDIMVVLCSGIASRITAQIILKLFVIPFLARKIVAISTLLLITYGVISSDVAWYAKDNAFLEFLRSRLPESVLAHLPFTVLTMILLIFLVPFALDAIDDFFMDVAEDSKKEETKED